MIEAIALLHKRALSGGVVGESEWSAAESAAWSAIAKKILRLLSEIESGEGEDYY